MHKAVHQVSCFFQRWAGSVVSRNEFFEWNVERSVQFIQDHHSAAGESLRERVTGGQGRLDC